MVGSQIGVRTKPLARRTLRVRHGRAVEKSRLEPAVELLQSFVISYLAVNRNWLRLERERKGWTQEEAAAHLGVSQTYLSLVENHRRPVSARLAKKLQRQFAVPATALRVQGKSAPTDAEALANALGALGYPGFAQFKRGHLLNPAQLVFDALRTPNLELRLAEALPWVACHYPDLDWGWLVPQAKLYDLQNRLGFVVGLAREVAERKKETATAETLATMERLLEWSRLAREDTLCRERMTQAERRWLRERRPALAQHWNLLTGLVPDHLPYAA
jgi:transcriptional regulator with XRE-family HTH domain